MSGTAAASAPAPIVLTKSRRDTDAQNEHSRAAVSRSLISAMGANLLVLGVIMGRACRTTDQRRDILGLNPEPKRKPSFSPRLQAKPGWWLASTGPNDFAELPSPCIDSRLARTISGAICWSRQIIRPLRCDRAERLPTPSGINFDRGELRRRIGRVSDMTSVVKARKRDDYQVRAAAGIDPLALLGLSSYRA